MGTSLMQLLLLVALLTAWAFLLGYMYRGSTLRHKLWQKVQPLDATKPPAPGKLEMKLYNEDGAVLHSCIVRTLSTLPPSVPRHHLGVVVHYDLHTTIAGVGYYRLRPAPR